MALDHQHYDMIDDFVARWFADVACGGAWSVACWHAIGPTRSSALVRRYFADWCAVTKHRGTESREVGLLTDLCVHRASVFHLFRRFVDPSMRGPARSESSAVRFHLVRILARRRLLPWSISYRVEKPEQRVEREHAMRRLYKMTQCRVPPYRRRCLVGESLLFKS